MAKFEDREKRSWTLTVTVETVRRVREDCGVNLLTVVDGDLIERLVRDPVLLCDVLFAACKQQAQEYGVSRDQFDAAFAGDTIDAATRALLEGLVDFFPRSQDRANLRRVLAKTWEALELLAGKQGDQIETIDVAAAVERALKPSNGSSGGAPESPESTPDRSLSASC